MELFPEIIGHPAASRDRPPSSTASRPCIKCLTPIGQSPIFYQRWTNRRTVTLRTLLQQRGIVAGAGEASS